MSYYSPTRYVSVEMEEALKAGHVLEPESGMQVCARVAEVDDANSVHSSVLPIMDRCPYPEVALDMSCSIIERESSVCGFVIEQGPSCDHHSVGCSQLLSVVAQGWLV